MPLSVSQYRVEREHADVAGEIERLADDVGSDEQRREDDGEHDGQRAEPGGVGWLQAPLESNVQARRLIASSLTIARRLWCHRRPVRWDEQ